MPLPRARTTEGQAGLAAIVADPAHALLASDYDGTAPDVAKRNQVGYVSNVEAGSDLGRDRVTHRHERVR